MKIKVNPYRLRFAAILASAWAAWSFAHNSHGIGPQTFGLPPLDRHLLHAEIGIVGITMWGLWRIFAVADYD